MSKNGTATALILLGSMPGRARAVCIRIDTYRSEAEAIIIAVPQYDHPKKKYPNLIFGLMFQERLYPHYRKMKDMIESGSWDN